MQKVKIPIFNDTYTSIEAETLSVIGTEMKNCYVDSLGYLRTRPALVRSQTVSKPSLNLDNLNCGIFWSITKQCLLWVGSGFSMVLKYNSGGDYFDQSNFSEPLISSGTCTFAEASNSNVVTPTTYVAIAQGGRIFLLSGIDEATTTFAVIADADAPIACSHVDSIDGFLVGNSGKRTFQVSDVNAPDTWSALSFASAMRNPDKTLAIKVYQRQIFIFGENTTEIWQIDPTSLTFPFSPVSGGFLDIGLFAPYSPVVAKTGLYWITNDKRLARYKDGNIDYPAENSDFLLSKISVGYFITISEIIIRGIPFLFFTFLNRNEAVDYNVWETWLFNQNTKQWSQWTSVNRIGASSAEEKESSFLGYLGAYSPVLGNNYFIGRREDILYKLKEDGVYDVSFINGSDDIKIRASRKTGHLDFGTNARKRTREVLFRVKAGQGRYGEVPDGTNRPAARLQVRWNDDNKGFSNWTEVPLGDVGDYEIVRKFKAPGIYRTRQYEISFSDASSYIFGEVEEEMEILR